MARARQLARGSGGARYLRASSCRRPSERRRCDAGSVDVVAGAGDTDELQEALHLRIGKAVADAVEESVAGPAMVDFTGFMVIDLKQDDRVRTPHRPGELISAPVGSLLELSFFVYRDERGSGAAPTMQSGDEFWVVEPIHLEGGRPARHVEFEAVADSPTLHPLPNRRTLTVGPGADAADGLFAFPMPEQPGRHEAEAEGDAQAARCGSSSTRADG